MAAAGYQYVLELVDKLSGPAKTAASETARLTSKLTEEAQRVKDLEGNLRAIQNTKAKTTDHAKKLAAAEERVAKDLERARASASGTGDQLRKLAKDQQAAAESGNSLSAAWAAAGPYIAAAAAVLAVLGGAVIGFALWGGKMALEASAFKKQTMSALESATGTVEGARSAFAIIRKASDEIGIAEEKAQKLGASLLDAGVAQDGLADSIKAIAMLEKVRGEESAKKLEDLVKKSAAAGKFKFEAGALEGSGLSQADVVSELATRMRKSTAEVEAALKAGTISANDGISAMNAVLGRKLGGSAKGLQTLDGAVGKFREKIGRLFEDVNVGPFLELVEEVSALFDSSTVSGQALKFLATTIFDGLFAMSKAAFPYIKTVLLELVIIALKLYIAAKPIVAKVRELWASASEGETLTTVLRTVVNVAVGIALVIGVVVAAVIGFQMALTAAVYYGIYLLTQLQTAIGEKLVGAWEFVKSLFSAEGATGIATALIDGLVGGITGGAGRVIEALTGVGKGAIGAVKSVLGIASPSKVMAELGGYTAEGFAGGVEEGSEGTQGALAAAVAPPPAAAPSGGGGGASVTISEGAIVIHAGGANAAEIAELLPAKLAELLESLGLQLGGAPSPAR